MNIQAAVNSQSDTRLKFSSKLCYGFGDLASNLCWTMVTTYLLFFYTDILQLNLTAISTLFFIARLWDAINDPIMGYIADRTHSRWGRFRPYLLFGPIFLSLFLFLCFTVPEMDAGAKLTYAYITYIFLGMSYTLVNMPYGAMAASLTQNADERSSLSGFRVFFAIIGSIIVSSAVLPLVKNFGGSESSRYGFSMVALIFAVLMLPLYFIVFKGTREVVKPNRKEKVTLKAMWRVILKNKPLLLILLSTLIASVCLFIKQSMLIFYCTYVIGNADLSPLFLALMAGMMLVGIVSAAPLAKRLGSKKITMVVGLLVSGLSCLCMYITGPLDMTLLYIWIIISSVFAGLTFVMTWSMVADTIEYAEWKTGIRADGVIYSAASFTQKLATAVSGWAAAFILSVTGYVANTVQNDQVLFGINFSMTILPGAALIIASVPLIFYTLNRKEFNHIVSELTERSQSEAL